jgi:hypothetical protein
MSLQCYALPCAREFRLRRPIGQPFKLSRELAMSSLLKPKAVFALCPLSPRERIEKGDCRKVNLLLTQVECNFHKLTEEQIRELRELGKITDDGFAIDTIRLPFISLSKEQIEKLLSYFPNTRNFTCKSVSESSLKIFRDFKNLQSLSILDSEAVFSPKGVESLAGMRLKKLELSRCSFAVDLLQQFPDLVEINLNFKGGGMSAQAIAKIFKEHKTLQTFNGEIREKALQAELERKMETSKVEMGKTVKQLQKEMQELQQDNPPQEKKSKPSQKLSFLQSPEVPPNVRKLRTALGHQINRAKRFAKTAEAKKAIEQREQILKMGDKFWKACSQAHSAAKRAKKDDSKHSGDSDNGSLVPLFDALKLSMNEVQNAVKDSD